MSSAARLHELLLNILSSLTPYAREVTRYLSSSRVASARVNLQHDHFPIGRPFEGSDFRDMYLHLSVVYIDANE